ncbi:hypothetical protein MTO96_021401 [Rhipicephalus appendiculatus]
MSIGRAMPRGFPSQATRSHRSLRTWSARDDDGQSYERGAQEGRDDEQSDGGARSRLDTTTRLPVVVVVAPDAGLVLDCLLYVLFDGGRARWSCRGIKPKQGALIARRDKRHMGRKKIGGEHKCATGGSRESSWSERGLERFAVPCE